MLNINMVNKEMLNGNENVDNVMGDPGRSTSQQSGARAF
jgi:hypothetical protein